MDQFFDEMKHKNERVVMPTQAHYQHAKKEKAQMAKLVRWADSHIAAETETEADRQFIASAKLLAALPKKQKRFSWAGVIGFLLVAVIVGGLTYLFVEGF